MEGKHKYVSKDGNGGRLDEIGKGRLTKVPIKLLKRKLYFLSIFDFAFLKLSLFLNLY